MRLSEWGDGALLLKSHLYFLLSLLRNRLPTAPCPSTPVTWTPHTVPDLPWTTRSVATLRGLLMRQTLWKLLANPVPVSVSAQCYVNRMVVLNKICSILERTILYYEFFVGSDLETPLKGQVDSSRGFSPLTAVFRSPKTEVV